MVAALDNGVKGGKWFGLIDKVYAPKTLELAWQKVRANRGAAGVDGQSVKAFGANAAKYLEELGQEIRENRYRPQPVKRVEIPKSDGKKRPLGIPTVKDRIVQAATKMVIEPIFEHQFLDMSYGFRPGRGCKDALREVDELIKDGYTFVVDADLKGYFDSIPQDKLLERVKERISDGRVIGLIDSWLKQDVMHGMERWTPTRGTPQGAVISPLLANIYLHPLDEAIRMDGYRMVRYADDFVILCRTREEADAALERVRTWVTANGLTLHPDKTHVGNCMNEGEGFDFLGYRFEAGRRLVREKSMKTFKDKVRGKTRRTQGQSLSAIIADLNPALRGWFDYFQRAQPWSVQISGRLHQTPTTGSAEEAGETARTWTHSRRPQALAKRLLHGGRAVRFTHSPPNREPLPMRKLPTGEPYAGKPPVRFGGRGGRNAIPTPIAAARCPANKAKRPPRERRPLPRSILARQQDRFVAVIEADLVERKIRERNPL